MKIPVPTCPQCEQLMEPVISNQGFEQPAGPTLYEIVAFECAACGITVIDDDREENTRVVEGTNIADPIS